MANKYLNVLSNSVKFNKNKITIDTSEADLDGNTSYEVVFPEGSVKLDDGSNANATIESIKFKTLELSVNGRNIYRHSSNRGIVIECMIGTTRRKLFVYDELSPSLPMTTVSLSESALQNVECAYNSNHNGHAYPSSGAHRTQLNNVFSETNSVITSNNVKASDINLYNDTTAVHYDTTKASISGYGIRLYTATLSSKTLCQTWIDNNVLNSETLLKYSRNINVPGIGGLDIPSIRELQVILSESGKDFSNMSDTDKNNDIIYNFFKDKKLSNYMTCNTSRYYNDYGNGSVSTFMVYADVNLTTQIATFMGRSIGYTGSLQSFLVKDITDL